MVQLGNPWVEAANPARAAIEQQPMLAAIVQRIQEAQAALHATQGTPDEPRLAAISKEQFDVDLRHDNIIRGLHMVLTGFALLVPERAEELTKLRDILLPDGLQATQVTYRAEAGAAQLLQSRLSTAPSSAEQLASIGVLDKTLTSYLEEWGAQANKLGQLEDEKAKLTPSAPDTSPREVDARNKWIRSVNALIANAALADLDSATDHLIFGSLCLAEKTADRRVKAPKADESVPTSTEQGSD